MIKQSITIKNKSGLHMRPASIFVKTAKGFTSNIAVVKEEKEYNAKSVTKVLSASVKNGDTIELTADGEDEQEAIEALVSAINSGLGE